MTRRGNNLHLMSEVVGFTVTEVTELRRIIDWAVFSRVLTRGRLNELKFYCGRAFVMKKRPLRNVPSVFWKVTRWRK